MWNSRGGRKKYQKLIVGRLEKTEHFNRREGWLLNCFFLSFSNHENYSIKNICVYSKSKMKIKLTSKQNLEHLKMINRRLFIHKFCNNSIQESKQKSNYIIIKIEKLKLCFIICFDIKKHSHVLFLFN